MKKLALASIIYIAFSCNPNNTTDTRKNENTSPQLPNTPESIVRAWEENVNKNLFNIPRQISVDEALKVVNAIAGPDDSSASEILPFEIIGIKCSENDDVSECILTFKDDYGQRANKYTLIKKEGQWYLSRIEDIQKNNEQQSDKNSDVKVAK
jgi:hypothetical protein